MSDSDFGPNDWLVDEMYRQFREDPSSVSPSWREFFEDYRPRGEPSPRPPEQPSAPRPRQGKEPATGGDTAEPDATADDARKDSARKDSARKDSARKDSAR
ncbi:MAG: 2-oxoglutarate dehydrogenase E1 subunit family protein, partial [bacterium]